MERFSQGDVLIEKEENGQWHGYTNQYHPIVIESSEPLSGRVHVRFDRIEDGHYIGRTVKED